MKGLPAFLQCSAPEGGRDNREGFAFQPPLLWCDLCQATQTVLRVSEDETRGTGPIALSRGGPLSIRPTAPAWARPQCGAKGTADSTAPVRPLQGAFLHSARAGGAALLCFLAACHPQGNVPQANSRARVWKGDPAWGQGSFSRALSSAFLIMAPFGSLNPPDYSHFTETVTCPTPRALKWHTYSGLLS